MKCSAGAIYELCYKIVWIWQGIIVYFNLEDVPKLVGEISENTLVREMASLENMVQIFGHVEETLGRKLKI